MQDMMKSLWCCLLPVLLSCFIAETYGASSTPASTWEDWEEWWFQHAKGKDQTCADYDCMYGAVCVTDTFSNPECQCLMVCSATDLIAPLCSTDGDTYLNECELQQRRCQLQRSIVIAHMGSCEGCEGYCYNGGTCTHNSFGKSCSCAEGYYGSRCLSNKFDWSFPTFQPDFNWGPDKNFDVTLPPIPQDFVEDTSSMWVTFSIVVGIIVLGMMFGMLHLVIRQRRRRRILIRTIQVREAQNYPQHGVPQGILGFPGLPRNPIQCLAPRIHQGIAIPPQYEPDNAPLLSTRDRHVPTDSSTVPSVITTGAPPPYTEVAPQDGGQSLEEPPPPYPGP